MNKRLTLTDWISQHNFYLSESEEKKMSKLMDKQILYEFVSHNEITWVSWQEFGSHKNVYCWILLEKGQAIGWNENPARGWSFPMKKVPSNIKAEIINKVLAENRIVEEYNRTISALEEFDKTKELSILGSDYTIEQILKELKNKSDLGIRFKDLLNKKTIQILKDSM